MARSPFTLAAAVTAAVPGAEVIGARRLSVDGDGRFDSAVATLRSGEELVIRVAGDDEAARELAAEALALRALTPGARAMIPFRAAAYRGETSLDEHRALVTELLPGFQVEAAHIPPGRGAATSIGEAIAAVHALPASIVRTAGLPDRSAADSRAELHAVVDRSAATGHVPARLISRWLGAVNDDALWRFESTVTLGGTAATAFLFEDDPAAGPVVVGLVGWHGLSIGDPAIDLAWLSSAAASGADVRRAYAAAADRTPDDAIAIRGHLRAELEFARWLLHGEELHRGDIVEDATALLDALAESVRDSDLDDVVGDEPGREDLLQSALGAAERVPTGAAPGVDTSMQTDAYSPEELWVAQEQEDEPEPPESQETEEITGFASEAEESDPEETETQRAARAALQRWTSSSSEETLSPRITRSSET